MEDMRAAGEDTLVSKLRDISDLVRRRLRRTVLAMLLAVSACGGQGYDEYRVSDAYDEYRVSDAWGNQETVKVPAGRSVGEVSSFAHLADLLGGSTLSTGDRVCLMTNYNGPMLFGSTDDPSTAARRALEICGLPILASGE